MVRILETGINVIPGIKSDYTGLIYSSFVCKLILRVQNDE